jgi:nitrate reductase cytochrome c-type subunit
MQYPAIRIKFYKKESSMKKILSAIIATLAAVSFTTVVFAANVPTSTPASTSTAPAAEMKKAEAKPVKKHLKHHKLNKVAHKTLTPAAPAGQ